MAEFDVPEGMNPDDLLAAVSPDDETPEAVAPPPEEPPASPAPVAATPAQPRKGNVGKALAEARRKLRERDEYWQGRLATIEQERAATRATPSGVPPVQPFQMYQPDPSAALAAIEKTSAGLKPVLGEDAKHLQDGLGEVAKATLAAASQQTQVATRQILDAVVRHRQQEKEAELREELAEQGVDYDDLITRSGVYDAIRIENGQFRDPAMAREVYGSANWARRAVRLAQAILAKQNGASAHAGETEEEIEEAATPAPTRARQASAPSVTPPVDVIAEARRAGARETVEAIATNTQRHRGVRVVRNAGSPPQVGLNPEFWDRLDALVDSPRESDRLRAQQIFDRNPHLSDWYERGRPRG